MKQKSLCGGTKVPGSNVTRALSRLSDRPTPCSTERFARNQYERSLSVIALQAGTTLSARHGSGAAHDSRRLPAAGILDLSSRSISTISNAMAWGVPGFALLTQARSLPKKQPGLFLRLP